MAERRMSLTADDMRKLRDLCREGCSDEQDHRLLEDLERGLERAVAAGTDDLDAGVVAMYSRVRVLDLGLGRLFSYTLVYPDESNAAAGRISVLAPVGLALLGAREGETVECRVPLGVRRLRLLEVLTPPWTAVARGSSRARPSAVEKRSIGRKRSGRASVQHPRGRADRRGASLRRSG